MSYVVVVKYLVDIFNPTLKGEVCEFNTREEAQKYSEEVKSNFFAMFDTEIVQKPIVTIYEEIIQ